MLIQLRSREEGGSEGEKRWDRDGIRYPELGNDWNGHEHGCVTTSKRPSFMVFMQQPLNFEEAGRLVLCDASPGVAWRPLIQLFQSGLPVSEPYEPSKYDSQNWVLVVQ